MEHNEILKILLPERTRQIGLAWSILNDSQLAEDVYQTMLSRAFEHDSSFESPDHLRDWSWKVLRNRCYELLRQRKGRVVLLDERALEIADTELQSRDNSELASRTDALRLCLEKLTDNARNIVHLRFFEGLRGDQVAEKLNRKPDTVYKSLQRIYDSLDRCINGKMKQIASDGSVRR